MAVFRGSPGNVVERDGRAAQLGTIWTEEEMGRGERMTLQQLKYVVRAAEKGSINEAAKDLFISQPSLSNAILELERELQFAIFVRNNRGISVTNRGAEFLGYARQVLAQTELLENKFLGGKLEKPRFCVSSQHYLFVANVFVELVRQFDQDAYDFALYETTTHEVIENVKTMFSELGILYLSRDNEAVLRRILAENNLIFRELFSAKPHVFLYRRHPLASRAAIDLDELAEYPRISFNQGQYNAFYFSEEILSDRPVKKSISVSDRAAVVNLMIGLDAYTICTGVFPRYLHGDDILSVPLNVDERIRVGTIMHKDAVLSDLGNRFYRALEEFVRRL